MAFFFVKERKIPRRDIGKNKQVIFILFFLSLLFYGLAKVVPSNKAETLGNEMIKASKIMQEALVFIRGCREEKGIELDIENDINLTGLIGVEYSPITTSLGSLEAKRTTTNPNFAGLVVFLLKKAGVSRGDAVAVGASGSFPGLIVAVLSASKAMGLEPLLISSLGASQWGANIPGFNWLHMEACFRKAGLFNWLPVAASLGGEKDVALNMVSEGRSLLIREIEKSGILFLHEAELKDNVEERMRIYRESSGNREINAFINIGGSWANMGTDSEILELEPGLINLKHFPPPERRGVIHEMALRKIPVIHLLHVRGLVRRFLLSWDPTPLPPAGEGKIFSSAFKTQPSFLLLAVVYYFLIILVLTSRKYASKFPLFRN